MKLALAHFALQPPENACVFLKTSNYSYLITT